MAFVDEGVVTIDELLSVGSNLGSYDQRFTDRSHSSFKIFKILFNNVTVRLSSEQSKTSGLLLIQKRFDHTPLVGMEKIQKRDVRNLPVGTLLSQIVSVDSSHLDILRG